jgi:hypothetical protein
MPDGVVMMLRGLCQRIGADVCDEISRRTGHAPVVPDCRKWSLAELRTVALNAPLPVAAGASLQGLDATQKRRLCGWSLGAEAPFAGAMGFWLNGTESPVLEHERSGRRFRLLDLEQCVQRFPSKGTVGDGAECLRRLLGSGPAGEDLGSCAGWGIEWLSSEERRQQGGGTSRE